MEVSRDFDKYTEEDIKAYDNARNMQVQLSILRERERNRTTAATCWREISATLNSWPSGPKVWWNGLML